jgi:hypothetical protein
VSEKSTRNNLNYASSPRRHGIAPFFDLECSVALAKPSGAVQFKRIGAEKGDSSQKQVTVTKKKWQWLCCGGSVMPAQEPTSID